MIAKRLLRLTTELGSRKWVCKTVGAFAQSTASRGLIGRFAKVYEVDTEEAEKPLSEYRTLNEFFTRRLKPGARPIAAAKNALVSPVDARVMSAGAIEDGMLMRVKGQDYTVEELLDFSDKVEKYRHGYYLILYLSPRDYHRIHVPFDGKVISRRHVPGKVYPVNDFGLQHMKRVLSRNERLITYVAHSAGEAAIVKVGAFNVSSIGYLDEKVDQLRKGDEFAYFAFGSTVVLLMQKDTFVPIRNWQPEDRVLVGEQLGELLQPSTDEI